MILILNVQVIAHRLCVEAVILEGQMRALALESTQRNTAQPNLLVRRPGQAKTIVGVPTPCIM